ncbi:3-hydroxyacyl-CoA dehydrogenase [Staphylococcus chromogenes]|uniref:3-hydroxyacyl-CoA dehydrogenase n=1 Tax=Staphylococcus chromogenes TaxID=46126 RepID=UPI002DBD2219|nr:3-hydroxyacyl-CoA dehydrogenase [Staphylococcus chromogenes]
MGFKKITVAGGGVLGSQIAFQAAFHGFEVVIYDINKEALKSAQDRLEKLKISYVKDMKASQERVDKTVNSIKLTANLSEAMSSAELLIEAVPENIDIKKEFYNEVSSVANEKTIFATNSSQLLPSDIKDFTDRPDRFLALHFANEVWKFNTAEVMRTNDTDKEVFNNVLSFASEMGMVAIPLYKEQKGYIQNSLLIPFLNAAEYLYAQDIADAHIIDKTWMKANNSRMGPFGAIDVIGLNTHTNILRGNKELSERNWVKKYINRLEEMISKGYTGKTDGKGFYEYPNPEYERADFFDNSVEIQSLEHGFKNVTVAGGGVLGSQIAFQAASGGFNVSLYDINEEAIESARNRIIKIKKEYSRDMDVSIEKVNEIERNINFFHDLSHATSDADIVIEVVPENIDIKKDFYSKLRNVIPEKTYVVTNTSTLKPSDFENAVGRPEKFAALHFANHVWLNNTGEVMVASKTSEETFNKILAFARDINLTVLPIKREQPGYILNTMLVPFLNAGLNLYAKGISTYDQIDKTWMVATGSPKGPFAIIDIVGLNTAYNISNNIYKSTGSDVDRKIVELLHEKINNGETGLNVGKGFYDYSSGIPYEKKDFL